MTSDFLFTDAFISAAKKHFDVLLFEPTFSSKDGDFLGAVAHHTHQEKKLLIVSSKTPVDILFPLIQTGKATTTLINPSCGVPGFANKGFWDMRDIAKARDFWLQVVEPIYQEQVIDFFTMTSSCYIRLNEHISWKDQLPAVDASKTGCISFQQYGYSWSNWTILCFWSLLVDTLYGAGYLQEEWHAMDVFVSSNPFFIIKDTLKESLQRTENLIIVIDQHVGSLYEIWVKAMLSEAGLNNISVHFITPYYQHISSVSTEYMYEQAQIDGFNMVKRIKV